MYLNIMLFKSMRLMCFKVEKRKTKILHKIVLTAYCVLCTGTYVVCVYKKENTIRTTEKIIL